MSLQTLALAFESALLQHSIPVETQDFGENEDEDHADKDPRLAHKGAHTLLLSVAGLVPSWHVHVQRLRRCQLRSLQPVLTGPQKGRHPCA